MRPALLLALLLATLAPAAGALDVFPSHVRLGDAEARVLVRLPDGGRLLVEGSAGVEAALAPPEGAPGRFLPLPATFAVEARPPEDSWHGLSGTVEVVLRRADASAPARVAIRDASGAGTEVEWPAATRDVPAPPAAAVGVAVALATAGAARRVSRGAGSAGPA